MDSRMTYREEPIIRLSQAFGVTPRRREGEQRGPNAPGLGSWLGLVLLSLSFWASTSTADAAGWLIQRRVLPEDWAESAAVALGGLAAAGVILGYLAAWRIYLWPLYHFPPTCWAIQRLMSGVTWALLGGQLLVAVVLQPVAMATVTVVQQMACWPGNLLGGMWRGFVRLVELLVSALLLVLRAGLTILRPVGRSVWRLALGLGWFLGLLLSTLTAAGGLTMAALRGVTGLAVLVILPLIAAARRTLHVCAVCYVLVANVIEVALGRIWRVARLALHYGWWGCAGGARFVTSVLARPLLAAARQGLGYVWLVVSIGWRLATRIAGEGLGFIGRSLAVGITRLVQAADAVARGLWHGVIGVFGLALWLATPPCRAVWWALGRGAVLAGALCVAGWNVACGVTALVAHGLWRSATAMFDLALWLVAVIGVIFIPVLRTVAFLCDAILIGFRGILGRGLRLLWLGVSIPLLAVVDMLVWGLRYLWLTAGAAARSLAKIVWMTLRTAWTGLGLLPDLCLAVVWTLRHHGEVPAMSQYNLTRSRLLSLVGTLWVAGVIAALVLPPLSDEPVVVTHWANGHMTSEALLPTFAKQFNAASHRTQSGKRIEIKVHTVNSGVITCQVIKRINPGVPCDDNEGTGGRHGDDLPHPTVITPVAEHWLGYLNYAVGQPAVDLAKTQKLATTYIGIVTLRGMAQCLGWPNKEIGFADIVALREDERGWRSCPTAKADWGKQPLISYTDPQSSTTGRSVLFTMYSIAAGRRPEQLTQEDVANPRVMEYVSRFQKTVDHYVPDTLILNSKVSLGPRYGHFFIIAEDNLVKLYQGKVKVTEGGQTKVKRLEQDMVMIYPKEGSTAHSHPGAIVRASWNTPEHLEAAERWVAYLREDPQQQAFMQEGFRPATAIPYVRPEGSRFWPEPGRPTVTLNPDHIDPAVAEAITASWGEIKNTGVVTFVLDTSGSMSGKKLEQAKAGLVRALDVIHARNVVGLVTFSDSVNERVPVAPIVDNRYRIADTVRRTQARGNTALYDAIAEGIRMADAAPAAPDTIRGVVVLTDGKANRGQSLDSVIRMQSSEDEAHVLSCNGFETERECRDERGKGLAKRQIIGTGLAMETRNRVHIFFIGIGDPDFDVCRMMAEATGSACQRTTEEALADLLEQYGKYF